MSHVVLILLKHFCCFVNNVQPTEINSLKTCVLLLSSIKSMPLKILCKNNIPIDYSKLQPQSSLTAFMKLNLMSKSFVVIQTVFCYMACLFVVIYLNTCMQTKCCRVCNC